MLIPIPLPRTSTAKNPWEQDLKRHLRSHPLPTSTGYTSPGTNYYSLLKKKYRNCTFSSQPQPEELEVYLGWTTSDVISEMRDLGYNVSLNIPQSIMSFDLGFGRLNFHFEPDKSIIDSVEFHPEI